MAVARYWRQQDQRYNLKGSECQVCGGHFFPKRTMCPVCHRRSLGNMEEFDFSGKGEIISFTRVHEGKSPYRSQVPYILAYIELDEGDQVIGQIVDCKPEDVEVNKKVDMVFRRLSAEGESGTIQYGFKFRILD